MACMACRFASAIHPAAGDTSSRTYLADMAQTARTREAGAV
jgi:hypothetical protein